MLVPSGSYKYCSWESNTWLTRAFPSSNFLDGKDSNKSEISFTSSNSHNNRVSVNIGSENKQTETEREENRCLTRPHARHGGSLRARAPRAPPCVGAGQRHRVGRFTCGAGRDGQVCAPDACPAG